MANNVTPFRLTPVAAPPPIGLYFRVGHEEHVAVRDLCATIRPRFHGGVFNAADAGRQIDLIKDMNQARFDTVLDTMTAEMATVGGWKSRYAELPWNKSGAIQVMDDWSDLNGRRAIQEVARFTGSHSFSRAFPDHSAS